MATKPRKKAKAKKACLKKELLKAMEKAEEYNKRIDRHSIISHEDLLKTCTI